MSSTVDKEIKFLRLNNVFHIIILGTSIFLYYIGLTEFYYKSTILYGMMKYSLIFLIIILILPIITLILIHFIKNNILFIKIMMKLFFIFIFFSIFVGVIINIPIWKSASESKNFTKYCPYKYTKEYMMEMILEQKQSLCEKKMCLYLYENDIDSLQYNYFCNFDSSKYFDDENKGETYKTITTNGEEIQSNLYIKCSKISNTSDISNEVIVSYSTFCNKNKLYICKLFEKPLKKYSATVNLKHSCPGMSYSQTSYVLAVSYILIDIICVALILLLEFMNLKKIFDLLKIVQNNNDMMEKQSRTINSTVREDEQDEEHNNKIGKNSTFKKEQTQTIIVDKITRKRNSLANIQRSEQEKIIYDEIVVGQPKNMKLQFADSKDDANVIQVLHNKKYRPSTFSPKKSSETSSNRGKKERSMMDVCLDIVESD